MIGIIQSNTIFFSEKIFLPETGRDRAVYTNSDSLDKARMLLYSSSQGKTDPRALNLIHMAERALDNGNALAAENYASGAVRLMEPSGGATMPFRPNAESAAGRTGAAAEKQDAPAEKQETSKHTYQDRSSDAGVSFTHASSLTAAQSFIAVPAHEAEHVGRRVTEAMMNGERIWVSVSYKVRYDPVTGEAYMAGGTTRTIKFSQAGKDAPGEKINMIV